MGHAVEGISVWWRATAICCLSVSMVQGDTRLRVLTTIPAVDCFTRNVVGELATVEMLLPAGSDPHSFALSPRDLGKVSKANVVVSHGLGVDTWITRAIPSSEVRRAPIVSTEGAAAEGNPHTWLDPVAAIVQVRTISDGLIRLDPTKAAAYRHNTEAYVKRLEELHSQSELALAPLRGRRLLTLHDSFHQFARRYGLEVAAVYQRVPGQEPTPRELRSLQKLIDSGGVTLFVAEPQARKDVFRTIAGGREIPTIVLDPMESGRPGADLYEKVMRANVAVLSALVNEKR